MVLIWLSSRPLYILGLTFQIPMISPALYLTLTLKGLGFDTFQSNLLTIPYTVLHSKSIYGFEKSEILTLDQ
jgi:hypothetical protein